MVPCKTRLLPPCFRKGCDAGIENKKSFLLYFDMYPTLTELSDQQRGQLFSALFDCAAREAECPGSGADTLDHYPDMSPAARMAFQFIAQTICRDTEKWHQKQLRCHQAALERERLRAERLRQDDEPLPL